MIFLRFFAIGILTLGLFVFPPWLLFIIGIIFIFVFNNFYEFIIFGILTDILYGGSSGVYLNIHFVYSIISIISYVILVYIKERVFLDRL